MKISAAIAIHQYEAEKKNTIAVKIVIRFTYYKFKPSINMGQTDKMEEKKWH